MFQLTNESVKLQTGSEIQAIPALREMLAARGETAAFQILLQPGRRMRVSVAEDPSFPGRLATERYRVTVSCDFAAQLYLERYLPDEEGVLRAELLTGEPAVEYDASVPGAVWVDIPIPLDAPSGSYPVTVCIFRASGPEGETPVFSQELTMTVHPYQMPQPAEYEMYLDLWQQNSNIARTYGTALWSDAHFAVLDRVVQSLAQLGQKSVTVLAGDCPWRGWACHLARSTPANLFEYSIVAITKRKDGVFTYDFSALERYIRLCERHGVCGDITVYGLTGIWKMPGFVPPQADWPEGVMFRYLDEADGCYRYLLTKEEILEYLRALFAWFRQVGLLDKVRVAADEPSDMEACLAAVALIRGVEPEVRFKMAINHAGILQTMAEEIHDCAASFPCTCSEHALLTACKQKHPEKRMLWYVCNIPWNAPNSLLHNSLLETRALGSMTMLFGFDGLLRWAYTCWPDNPRADIRYNEFTLPAGDVNFIYPAKDGGIDLSIRWKALKRGIEDYELLYRARSLCGEAVVQQALKLVIHNQSFKSYMLDDKLAANGICSNNEQDYSTMRRLLLDALQERGSITDEK